MANQYESDYVSPSQILDCMLSESDDPNIVVSWLEDAGGLDAIFANSLCWRRMFQLDFFLKLSDKNMDWVLSAADGLAVSVKATLAWQVLASKSPAVQFAARRLGARLRGMVESSGLRHPYALGYGKYIQAADEAISRRCALGDAASFPAAAPAGFSEYVKNMDYSLFAVRMAQSDVFSLCGDVQKWEMLQHVARRPAFWGSPANLSDADAAADFILQILSSDEDDAVKLESYRRLVGKPVARYQWTKAESALAEASSVQELLVKADIEGCAFGLPLVKCLMLRRPKWIVEWAGSDPTGFDQILPASGFIGRNAGKILTIHAKNRA